jgi:hypothetical protein
VSAAPIDFSKYAIPEATGPKGEKPVKTATSGNTKIGYYKSTGQWMLVPQQGASK